MTRPGPKTGPHGARTALLRVRVSEGEREAYQAAARRAGVSVGEWVRRALVPAAHACCGGSGMLSCESCNGSGEAGSWGGTCYECKGQGALPCSECLAAAEKEREG